MNDREATIADLKALVLAFSKERDWEQFHSPKDLGLALGSEVGELLDLFRFRIRRPDPGAARRPGRAPGVGPRAGGLPLGPAPPGRCLRGRPGGLPGREGGPGGHQVPGGPGVRPERQVHGLPAFERTRATRLAMNVIVVVCNGLHLGFLGAYGNSWIETPHLDRLATEGVVFDHHFPENLTTLPTRRSWWTGRYGFPDPDSGWTAAPARRGDPARPALEPGGPVDPDLRRPPAPRRRPGVRPGVGRGRLGPRPGVRPARPAGRPEGGPDQAGVRARPPPARRRRPRPRPLEGTLGAVPPEPRGPQDRRRGEHRGGPDRPRGPGLGRAVGRTIPARSCSGSTCSAPTAPGIRPSRIATSTPRPTPTSSRPARRATSSRTTTRRPWKTSGS